MDRRVENWVMWGSKTRSLGPILGKPCVHSGGHIFCPIPMKLGQKVCLDKISKEFEIGTCGVKTRYLSPILEKPCVSSLGHFSVRYS